MRRRPLLLLAAAALLAVVVVGFVQSSGNETSDGRAPTAAELRERLAGAPAPLARLHARANRLLPASSAKRELAALKGFPVVVNKWASWCGPCRAEFPTFQEVGAELGKEVAFLGLDAGDGPKPAAEFLARYPLSFPSLSDPDLEATEALGIGGSFWPTTAFFDATGKQTYVHQGPYLEADDLRADIAKYTARG
ncbi:MAG: TlpA family protein disulfide reductase [Solirubrobacterales bacterium]|jgi:cytochrome c biogenesis protein CcmG/thiol:disulfide interchange protein DsbE|nr:TlpA family protein disulfide reductase [Solirubrobacterales bacterium]